MSVLDSSETTTKDQGCYKKNSERAQTGRKLERILRRWRSFPPKGGKGLGRGRYMSRRSREKFFRAYFVKFELF